MLLSILIFAQLFTCPSDASLSLDIDNKDSVYFCLGQMQLERQQREAEEAKKRIKRKREVIKRLSEDRYQVDESFVCFSNGHCEYFED